MSGENELTGKSVSGEDDSGGSELPGVDSRVRYPCYKSFDEFINVEHLRLLDDFITRRIRDHIKIETDDYFLNEYRLDENSPYQSGVREIWLTRPITEKAEDYLDLDRAGLWEATEAADEFSPLMAFTSTLPFETTGRILIIYDDSGRAVPAHRDHRNAEYCSEFIWFRTNLVKPFYVLNHKTGEKKYVESYSAWFDTVNQFHGSDAAEKLSFSIRVDGRFTDEFGKQIPTPEENLASAPALWACLSEVL